MTTPQPQPQKKDDKKKDGQPQEGQSPAQAVTQWVANLANSLGGLLAGVGRSSVKTVKITDGATQVVRTPVGGQITGFYQTDITVEADTAVAQAIAEAQAEADKARAEAQLIQAKAKAEAQAAAAAAKPTGQH